MMMWPDMMGNFWGGAGVIGMILNSIFTLAIMAGIIFLVIWMVKRVNPSGAIQTVDNNTLEILKMRYASGEITKDEFFNLKKDLSQS